MTGKNRWAVYGGTRAETLWFPRSTPQAWITFRFRRFGKGVSIPFRHTLFSEPRKRLVGRRMSRTAEPVPMFAGDRLSLYSL
jgi:hypothetical protein